MTGVATLYVRDVPPELHVELKRWAAEAGRSVNAEVLVLLAREAARRREQAGWFGRVLELKERVALPPDAPLPEDLIREDRDRGHRPADGY